MAIVKKAMLWLVVAFFIYYLATQPAASAHAVRGVGTALHRLFLACQQFFTALVGGS